MYLQAQTNQTEVMSPVLASYTAKLGANLMQTV